MRPDSDRTISEFVLASCGMNPASVSLGIALNTWAEDPRFKKKPKEKSSEHENIFLVKAQRNKGEKKCEVIHTSDWHTARYKESSAAGTANAGKQSKLVQRGGTKHQSFSDLHASEQKQANTERYFLGGWRSDADPNCGEREDFRHLIY